MKAGRQGVKLVMVGSGPMLAELQAGGDADCHFEPAVRNVAPWLRAMDIFVLPSLSEALSNSLMEAMGCGCCPVASDTGGNPELVEDGETGLLFPVGDAEALAERLARLVDRAGVPARAGGAGGASDAGAFHAGAGGAGDGGDLRGVSRGGTCRSRFWGMDGLIIKELGWIGRDICVPGGEKMPPGMGSWQPKRLLYGYRMTHQGAKGSGRPEGQ